MDKEEKAKEEEKAKRINELLREIYENIDKIPDSILKPAKELGKISLEEALIAYPDLEEAIDAMREEEKVDYVMNVLASGLISFVVGLKVKAHNKW